jgi:hypothetical protein
VQLSIEIFASHPPLLEGKDKCHSRNPENFALWVSSVPPFEYLAVKYVIIISQKRNHHFQGYVCMYVCMY